MGYLQDDARAFAERIKAMGFKVYLAQPERDSSAGLYGFITDAEGARVVSFSFNDGGSLGGCYGPPSRESGTGWRMDKGPESLRTAADVKEALYSMPPAFCGKGWRSLTSAAVYLQAYSSSNFVEV
jgi:hypothetical protein